MEENISHTRSLKASADKKRSATEKLADWMTNSFGTVTFLLLNVLWFVAWLILNNNLIPNVTPFDPYPYGFLTMTVSLEAIILAIFVLISQNRAAKIADLREETDLQINEIAEREITKCIKLLVVLLKKNGVDISKDPELKEMIKNVNPDTLEKTLESQLAP